MDTEMEMAARARAEFDLRLQAQQVDAADEIFRYDVQRQAQLVQQKPWTTDVQYFKKVRISTVALLKMVIHARSGGSVEVMGMMQGKLLGDTIVVMDAFALPVEGTETRVNAQQEGYEYMVSYMELVKRVGRVENAVGWYHSHPGYGCWLSGIDVGTQMQNQQFTDPFVAVVIDPVRTLSSGKVELGAFRTFPKGHKAADEPANEYQAIPMSKIEDFGVHCKEYYALEVSYFKSVADARLLDQLWSKYWASTLSSSTLRTNQDFKCGQIRDLADKVEQAEAQVSRSNRLAGGGGLTTAVLSGGGAGGYVLPEKESADSPVRKVGHECSTMGVEAVNDLITQSVKHFLFNAAPLAHK